MDAQITLAHILTDPYAAAGELFPAAIRAIRLSALDLAARNAEQQRLWQQFESAPNAAKMAELCRACQDVIERLGAKATI